MQPEIRIYSVYKGILLRILLYTIIKNEKVMEDLSPFTNRNSETAILSGKLRLIYSDDMRLI
jgi:hypothetical protein